MSELPSRVDVVIVGSGAAGLYAGLCLPRSLQIVLLTKDTLQTGASDWAQGGIAAAISPTDSAALHYQDTIAAGAGLCDTSAVQFLVENAPKAIANLVAMGVAFDRKGEELAMTLEAAHSRPRVLHAADTTGRAIVTTLKEQVLARGNIHVITQALATSLWLHPQTGNCQGIKFFVGGKLRYLAASATILATGGGGQVFSQTTNPSVSTGDGVAMAYRAGAILRDLEFVQFHPTALTKAGAPRFLISEAVRGEGAHLVDKEGVRFAFNYHPQGELAPRDVVSRAIFNHLQATGDSEVYLDLRPIPEEKIRYRFPNIIRICQKWGINIFSEPIPVAPAAHYWMGGIAVDTKNQTSIPRLYAIGETASTGVHGANRLASNSLLECLVYAGELSRLEITPVQVDFPSEELIIKNDLIGEENQAEINLIRQELPRLVWHNAGICRVKENLEEAIAQVEFWREKLINTDLYQLLFISESPQIIMANVNDADIILKNYIETANLLDIAYLILKSALFRTESRGGHYRSDYPNTSIHWQVHTMVKSDLWY